MSRFRYNRVGIPSISRPRERHIGELFESYLERWQRVREACVAKCLADMLGHAREHDVRDFDPVCPGPDCLMCNGEACDLCGAGCWNNAPVRCEHDSTDRHRSAFAGIAAATEPFSIATVREAMVRALAYQPPPPVKPWISRHRAAQLEAGGIRRSLIDLVFQVY